MTSLGKSTDRLGRPVWGLQVTSTSNGTRETVLVSQETGRVIGVEAEATAGSDLIPRGGVIHYRMWDAED